GEVPQKCTLLGTLEQMGPAGLAESRPFWQRFADSVSHEGTRVRERERLCAVSLVKRFAWAAYFREELRLRREELRFDDTATEAAREWLADERGGVIDPDAVRRTHGDWSGQWLHWRSDHQDPEETRAPEPVWDRIQRKKQRHPEPAPLYFAVLMMDGDNMGRWLRGDMGLSF